MPATKAFADTGSFTLFSAVSAAFTFVVEVLRDTAALRRTMIVHTSDQE